MPTIEHEKSNQDQIKNIRCLECQQTRQHIQDVHVHRGPLYAASSRNSSAQFHVRPRGYKLVHSQLN